MKKNTFTELLQKPVTRKQFLVHIGLVAFTVSGASSLVKILSDPQLLEKEGSKGKKKQPSFGNGSYGI